jgi:hypothetical protein
MKVGTDVRVWVDLNVAKKEVEPVSEIRKERMAVQVQPSVEPVKRYGLVSRVQQDVA